MRNTAALRRMVAPVATLAPLLLLIAGCMQPGSGAAGSADSSRRSDQPPPLTGDVLITTDRDVYQVRRTPDAIELDILATFTNRTADTVYLHPCGRSQPSYLLEKWVSTEWQPAFSPPCPALLMLDPPRVAPGASRTDTARVRASLRPNTSPRFDMEPAAGTYRLVYAQAYGSWRANQGPGELLPLAMRTSRSFRIEE